MDQHQKLEALIDNAMVGGDLSPEDRDKAKAELTRAVLVAVGKAAIQGDAEAARLLFDMKLLRLH